MNTNLNSILIKKQQIFIAITIAVLVIVLSLFKPDVIERVQLVTFDTFQKISPRYHEEFPVYVVDIDEKTLRNQGQWPWARGKLADLLLSINQFKPSVIGLDVILSEPDRLNQDSEFKKKIEELPLVLAFSTLINEGGKSPVSKHSIATVGDFKYDMLNFYPSGLVALEEFQLKAKGNGSINTLPELDGVVRQIPLMLSIKDNQGYKTFPSFQMEILRVLQGAKNYLIKVEEEGIAEIKVGDININSQEDGSLRLHYAKKINPVISADDILQNNSDWSFLEGAIIIVGSSAYGLKDVVTTPISSAVAGYEVHVQALEQIFQGVSIERPFWMIGLERLVLILSVILTYFIVLKLKPFYAFLFALLHVISLIILSFVAFSTLSLLVDFTYVVLAVLLLFPIQSAYKYYVNEIKLITSLTELRLASEVQMATWPKQIPDFDNLSADGWSIPADDSGGDSYDFFEVGNKLFFTLGDATGHGISASLHAVMVRSMIRSGLNLGHTPDRVLYEVNNQLNNDTLDGRFVTLFLGIYNPVDSVVEFYSAGQGPILFYQKKSGQVYELNAKSPPLGVVSDTEFKQLNRAILEPGDAVIVTSDGIPEAKNNSGEQFSDKRLQEIIKSSMNNSCQQFSQILKKELTNFCQNTPADDDRTIVTIKRNE